MKIALVISRAVLLATLAFHVGSVGAQEPGVPTPLLSRIKMVTIGAPNLDRVVESYKWLGYEVREKGKVSVVLARGWGAPASAGHRYILLSPRQDADVFVRAVQTDAVAGYEPMTTWGWNAFEFVIDDVRALQAKLQNSPFTILGGPNPLKSTPSIVTMQIKGPAQEILYLANETGDRAKSSLPLPTSFVGRPFISILAGPDIAALRDWYALYFHLGTGSIRESGGRVVPQALRLPEGSSLPISLLSLAEPGNRIQLDGYKTFGKGARPHAPGQLPPGNAMVSYSVPTLANLRAAPISEPASFKDKAYAGHRTATVIGAAGELIELIEEPRP